MPQVLRLPAREDAVVVLTDGPARLFHSVEKGQIVIAVDAPPTTRVATIPARKLRALVAIHGPDPAALIDAVASLPPQ